MRRTRGGVLCNGHALNAEELVAHVNRWPWGRLTACVIHTTFLHNQPDALRQIRKKIEEKIEHGLATSRHDEVDRPT
eukprot:scaffold6230_cov127-Isochrysis_galbana.AAC.6